MDEVLGVALVSMHQDMARVERVAMNLSNALTPAYKRQISVAQAGAGNAHSFGMLWNAGMAADGSTGGVSEIHSDMRAGTLKSTGQSLDLALSGPGFFEVQTDNGPAYTRQGNFRISADGRIVTVQGHALQGKDGDVFASTANPTVDAAGNVTDDKRPVGQLKIVQFDKPEALLRIGGGLFAAGAGMRQVSDSEVRQGYLENANVSAAHEMVELMQSMRHFESMQKMTQAYDDMLGGAIRKLGEM